MIRLVAPFAILTCNVALAGALLWHRKHEHVKNRNAEMVATAAVAGAIWVFAELQLSGQTTLLSDIPCAHLNFYARFLLGIALWFSATMAPLLCAYQKHVLWTTPWPSWRWCLLLLVPVTVLMTAGDQYTVVTAEDSFACSPHEAWRYVIGGSAVCFFLLFFWVMEALWCVRNSIHDYWMHTAQGLLAGLVALWYFLIYEIGIGVNRWWGEPLLVYLVLTLISVLPLYARFVALPLLSRQCRLPTDNGNSGTPDKRKSLSLLPSPHATTPPQAAAIGGKKLKRPKPLNHLGTSSDQLLNTASTSSSHDDKYVYRVEMMNPAVPPSSHRAMVSPKKPAIPTEATGLLDAKNNGGGRSKLRHAIPSSWYRTAARRAKTLDMPVTSEMVGPTYGSTAAHQSITSGILNMGKGSIASAPIAVPGSQRKNKSGVQVASPVSPVVQMEDVV